MTFEEILAKVKSASTEYDASGVDFLAVQINITGKSSGVFYVEVKNGNISVEPYEYNDRSCALTMDGANFCKLMDGKLDPVIAYTTGKLKVEGDLGKALEFSKLLKK